MTDLHDALSTRSVRGVPRGADAVFDRALGRGPEIDWPRRFAVAFAAAVVVALVAVAVVVARRDEADIQGPADDGPSTAVGNGRIDPAGITVTVANGTGADGAASAVAESLQVLGYPEVEVLDATADPSQPPVEAVYFSLTPNSEDEARQVAADLGLPPGAVEPYPGVDAAPADIGLAEVLVVLGRSAAPDSEHDEPVTVTPSSGLRDQDRVMVRVEAGDGIRLQAAQCRLGPAGAVCDPATRSRFTRDDNTTVLLFTVRRSIDAPGPVDCAAQSCLLFIRELDTGLEVGSVFLAFTG